MVEVDMTNDVEELRRILHPLVLDIESVPYPVIKNLTVQEGQPK